MRCFINPRSCFRSRTAGTTITITIRISTVAMMKARLSGRVTNTEGRRPTAASSGANSPPSSAPARSPSVRRQVRSERAGYGHAASRLTRSPRRQGREVVALKRLNQILDKRADLGGHGPRLSVDRHQCRGPRAFPIWKNGHKLARAKFIFNVESTWSDYSASGDASFTERIVTLDQQLRNEFYLLPHLRFDKLPFIQDVAFYGYKSDACVAKKVSRYTGSAGAIEVRR